MAKYTNQQLMASVKNGEPDILFYITRKYYQPARRWLRRKGYRDSETPLVFSRVLVNVCREIQHKDFSQNIDFEKFYFNSLYEYDQRPEENASKAMADDDIDIAAGCYTILDEESKRVLSDHYVEGLSFEEIAVKRNFSNPVIAQFECTKAFSQLENIVKVRLNISA